jgi:hypothetical protein
MAIACRSRWLFPWTRVIPIRQVRSPPLSPDARCVKRILILGDMFGWRRRYLVDALALRWREAGHRIITRRTLRHLPDADVVILHVDRTVVPGRISDCLKSYPVVLNRHAVDISKRVISRQLVAPGDDYAGPVVVKTDANCGGLPEKLLSRYLPTRLGRGRAWAKVATMRPDRYPVFADKAEVPPGVWENPALIVERFLPERRNDLYYLRYWIFLGGKGWAGRLGSRHPIVKFGNAVTPEEPVEVPDALKAWRTGLGFDFGRFDFVVHDGEVILLDVNKTIGGTHRMNENKDRLDYLATGIEDF